MSDTRPRPFADLDASGYALDPALDARLPTPALVVFLDAVRHNVARVIELCGGDPDRWRPHLKTTKTPAVWAELFAAGVRRFKCATTLEAELLLETAADLGERADLLVAYPHVGPNLERLGRLAQRHGDQRLSVLVETPEAARRASASLGLALDLNPGMDRTGIPLDDVERFWATCDAAGERLSALHFYDGHETGPHGSRRAKLFAGYDRVFERFAELRARHSQVDELITSGSPAFESALAYAPFAALDGARHRVSPGTVVFHDLRSELQDPARGLRPAALVRASIVSAPRPGRVTLDSGSKTVGADAGSPIAHVVGRPGWRPRGPSEEHLPVDLNGGSLAAHGERVWLVPRHVCTTVNLAHEALLIDPRGEPRVVPIAARGHRLGL